MPSRRSFLARAGLLALAGGGVWLARDQILWKAPEAEFTQGADTTGWLLFAAPGQGLATVRAAIAGVEVDALIDSGAQYSVIDRAFAERLQLGAAGSVPLLALGVGGSVQAARAVNLSLDLAGLRFPRLRAAVLELGHLARAGLTDTSLILGWDVLAAVVADIDFPRRRLSLTRPQSYVLPPGAVAAPVRKQGRGLVGDVKVNGAPLRVLVDTGATGWLGLPPNAAEAVGLLAGGAAVEGRSIVLGGIVRTRIVKARTVDFAGEAFGAVDVHVIDLPQVPGFPQGLLGVDLLRRFRVILDAGAGSLHLIRR